MLQTIITYEKASFKVISAIQVSAFITEADILKMSGYEVLMTFKDDAIRIDENKQMYINSKHIK